MQPYTYGHKTKFINALKQFLSQMCTSSEHVYYWALFISLIHKFDLAQKGEGRTLAPLSD